MSGGSTGRCVSGPTGNFEVWATSWPTRSSPGCLSGIVFTVIYAWPWIDKRIYSDYGHHNLLDRPRDKPLRTAIGVAALIFFTDLTLASATDVIGTGLHISFELLIEILPVRFVHRPDRRPVCCLRGVACYCNEQPRTRSKGPSAAS